MAEKEDLSASILALLQARFQVHRDPTCGPRRRGTSPADERVAMTRYRIITGYHGTTVTSHSHVGAQNRREQPNVSSCTVECGSKYGLYFCVHFYFLALAAAIHLLSLFSLSVFCFVEYPLCFACIQMGPPDLRTLVARQTDQVRRSTTMPHPLRDPH